MPSRSVSIRPEPIEVEADDRPERAVMLRKLLRVCARRPADMLGCALMLALAGTIIANALFRQQGSDPDLSRGLKAAPSKAARDTTGSFVVMLRPHPNAASSDPLGAPATAAHSRPQIVADLQRELQRRGFYDGAIDGLQGPKMDAAIGDFSKAAGLHSSGQPSEALLQAIVATSAKVDRSKAASPARRPPTAARVLAVQRALSQFGYGQIKLNGSLDTPTKAALEKFERDHKLPPTGQISDRVVHELATLTGKPIE